MSSATLSPPQLEALLDILVHHETYTEVLSFKDPEAIDRYGYPFANAKQNEKSREAQKSASPLLQLLLTRIVLPVPGVRDLPAEFWNDKFKGIMRRFGDAELSESYDKGTLGLRKRLASAASVIHESVTRGLLNGVPSDGLSGLQDQYESKKAEDLIRAWDDSVHKLVYGNLVDELFDQFTKSEDLEAHSPAAKAAIEYAIIYLGTFLHHVFVLSSEGPYLLKLLDNVHKLVPYTMIGQTLRIGNAGTMISGMVRLFLAKVSVGAISNWIGLTQGASDGMNLLQRIISLVLGWDAGDFRKVTDNIRKGGGKAIDEQLTAIDQHLEASRSQHDFVRQKSIQENKSIIITILESKDPKLATITDAQHSRCLEYYSALLAIQDRDKIVEVLCRQTPDLTTSIIRDGVSVFEPMIRTIHKQVDLKKHFWAFQSFLDDLIGTSKPTKVENGSGEKKVAPPCVEDYVELLRRNRHLLYAYLHEFAKGCPELRDTWREWLMNGIKVFRQNPETETRSTQGGTDKSANAPNMKDVSASLQDMFNGLPEDIKQSIRVTADAHFTYLSSLEDVTRGRIQRIIDNTTDSTKRRERVMIGPGMYASRWQSLLDETIITSGTPYGPPRRGEDVNGLKAPGKTEAMVSMDACDSPGAQQEYGAKLKPPDVTVVVDALGSQFKMMMADLAGEGLPGKPRV